MDIGKLERLAKELFVDNIKNVSGKYVTPLNTNSLGCEINASEERRRERDREIYESLVQVMDAIDRDGGISEPTYDANKYAINSLARDLTDQRWWGSGLDHLCEAEDREGKKATPKQVERYPDGKYGSIAEDLHENILDEDDKSGFEGTFFQIDYDSDGNLNTYRIFHQGHRNALNVTSVEIPTLINRIRSYIEGFSDKSPSQDFGLTLDRNAYLRKIDEFNMEFGDCIRVKVVEDEGKTVVVEVNQNPEQLANRLVELGKANGRELSVNMGAMTYSLSGGSPDYHFLDLFLPSQIDHSERREQFDPIKHRNSPTVILPHITPSFSIPLLKMYAAQSK